ncbi:MAG: hypothetical protein MI723_11815 [Caulobacterales bacterium]|nr:hypothetical protein [Caulobacterales bacterium]
MVKRVAGIMAAWAVGLLAGLSFLGDLTWVTSLGAAAPEGVGGVASAIVGAWRAATYPVEGLIGLGAPEGLARKATDLLALAVLFLGGAMRALAMRGAGDKLEEAAGQRAAERILRKRLPALYRRIDGLDERAGDKDAIADDAKELAPWCAKFNEFLQTKEDDFEVDLDRAWLVNTINQNVTLNFEGASLMQAGSWKAAIANGVVEDLAGYMVRTRRASGAGAGFAGRLWRRALAAMVVLGGAAGVEAAFVAFGG